MHCAFHENRIGGRIKFYVLSKISEGEILSIFLKLLSSREGGRWGDNFGQDVYFLI